MTGKWNMQSPYKNHRTKPITIMDCYVCIIIYAKTILKTILKIVKQLEQLI